MAWSAAETGFYFISLVSNKLFLQNCNLNPSVQFPHEVQVVFFVIQIWIELLL